ncbi:restriction endonuclease subunit S [Butyrivibrio proteoclasticus]|uniref:restriction endonuclease subunit S n=1 Tax=Butyrivibrio proteoclasticus TaxID=43305 RepID=UPI00047BDB2F|nr:restriction endonuclease subunit S [Butyrivibrio proteoclasticus]
MKWEKVRLGDVTDSCLGKMLDKEKNRGEYQLYLSNKDVRWGSFDLEHLDLMKFEEHEEERYGVRYGDLIVCEGGEPGRCAIWKDQIPNMKIQKALHRVRVHEGLDYRFLYYWFLWAGKRGELQQYFTGATIKHMPGDKLKSVIIAKPDIETQRQIADVLSAYDDLIENNQKQIKLLEEAAQRLYKEWFVDFRFPGHEDTEIVDGVPDGWKKGNVGHLFKTVLGGTPSRNIADYWGGDIPWINSGEVNKLRIIKESEFITERGLNNSSTKLMPKHTTVLAITGATLGQVSYTEIETCANQSVVGVYDETGEYSAYIYLCITNEIKKIISEAIGGAQQHINKEVVNKFEILLPSFDVNERMKAIVVPMFDKITNLYFEIERLSEARDRLLPKLMSGEIEL